MKEEIILKIEKSYQGEQPTAGLFRFNNLLEAEAQLTHWLGTVCGLQCCHAEAADELRKQNGGALPDMVFVCPQINQPQDLEAYSGHYFYGFGGAVSLFVMAIWDTESAQRFRLEATKEFALDAAFSEEADEMLEMLSLLERSFQEDCQIDEAIERLDRLVANDGLSLF